MDIMMPIDPRIATHHIAEMNPIHRVSPAGIPIKITMPNPVVMEYAVVLLP
jgi:hypothetical protein